MRNATKGLLIAAVVFAVTSGNMAGAADRAGIGLEWGWAPTINLNGLDSDFAGTTFSLDWKVTDSFSVGVASNAGFYSGSHEYTDNTVTPNIKHNIRLDGQENSTVLRILATVPVVTFLQAGLEAGVMQIGGATYTYVNSDGTTGSAANFGAGPGVAPNFGNQTEAIAGVMAKATLVQAESKTVSAAISVSGGLRFVNLPDTYAFGSQESNSNSQPLKKIDPITNMNSLSLVVEAGLWF